VNGRSSYRFEQTETSPEHIAQYATFLSSAFPETHKYSVAYVGWQYRLNPNGPVVGFDAWADDELVSHYVTLPVAYAIDGEMTRGLLSLNTATHPNHRGKDLFTELASNTYELGRDLGYRFVIGVANENSTHGFLERLGFRLISPLDVRVGCGTFRTTSASSCRLAAAWNEETLHWRLGNPSGTYTRRGRELYAEAGRFGIRAVVALDKQVRDDDAKRIPFAPLKVWIGIDRQLRTRGIFVDLPRRMRPSPLNCILRDLRGDLPTFEKGDVRFGLIDFDAY